jgi:hypothetical protein
MLILECVIKHEHGHVQNLELSGALQTGLTGIHDLCHQSQGTSCREGPHQGRCTLG